MLIGASGEAFDSPDYIYELKLDGVRCIAYLDPNAGTELRNKRNINVTATYPELGEIHKQVKKRCILDGAVLIIKDGKPDFSEMQRRALMGDPFKIRLAANSLPVCFTAFDILYLDKEPLIQKPLMERKKASIGYGKRRNGTNGGIPDHRRSGYCLLQPNRGTKTGRDCSETKNQQIRFW